MQWRSSTIQCGDNFDRFFTFGMFYSTYIIAAAQAQEVLTCLLLHGRMSTRTVSSIEADIEQNPNWFSDAGDKMLITAFTTEKNLLLQQKSLASAPEGDYSF